MKLLGIVTAPILGVVRTVTALPRVVDAVLVLPTMADRLDDVSRNTDALPDMLAELKTVRGDTASLPHVHEELTRVHAQLEDLCKIVSQVETNTLAVEQLAEIAVPLQGAALRVGRLADRFPQRRFSGNGDRGGLTPQRDAGDDQAYAE